MYNQQMCGGLSENIDANAPKEIKSEDMTLFKIETAMQMIGVMISPSGEIITPKPIKHNWINFISLYAAKTDGGAFMVVQATDGRDRHEFKSGIVSADIFPTLVKLVNENNLAKNNGRHSFSYGLPQNFGGEIQIDYSSGESISISDNRSPMISKDLGSEFYELFTSTISESSVPLPDAETITEIRFDSSRDEAYSHITLTDNGDGTCHYTRECRYEDPTVFNDEKTLSAELIEKFRRIAGNCSMLIWDKLPQSSYIPPEKKSLTFTLSDGKEYVVPNDRLLPNMISHAFFDIELELTSKW